MLFLSKGEGFGMPPREAMATGMPVIFANNTGMESMDSIYNWGIRTAKTEPSPLGGNWRIPDWDQAIDAMRWVYEHQEKAFSLAEQGAKWFVENHGADVAAKQLIGLVESIDPESSERYEKKPPKATTWLQASTHEPFWKAVADVVPPGAVIYDVGLGEGGMAYWQLSQMGFDV